MGWRSCWAGLLGWQLITSSLALAEPLTKVPSFPVETYRLPSNGLTVVLSEDHSLPIVAVNLWYLAGPRNETPGRSGFAHLFEHLMFEGSKHIPSDAHLKWLEAKGGTDLNATTSFDRTNYYETVPANELEFVLWLESDRMGFLLDTMTQEKLDGQRKVVQNERRQSYENAPYGPSREAVGKLLYPLNHPYAGNIIGSMEHLNNATLADVAHFYHTYYAPANAVLTLVGDFESAQAKALVERYFATLQARPAPNVEPLPAALEPNVLQEKRIAISEPVLLPRITMAWHAPKLFAQGDAEADVLAHLLGQGPSSRLHRSLVLQEKLAQGVEAYQHSLLLGSQFQIVAQGHAGVSLARLEAAIDKILKQLLTEPPTASEVERAKLFLRQRLLQSLQYVGDRADMLSSYQVFLGHPDKLAWDLQRYQDVTSASIMATSSTWLLPEKRIVVTTIPEKES